jgi:PAS domain S-box-containing protein
VVALNNFEENTITIAYVSGKAGLGSQVGSIIPLNGSINEEIVRTRSSILIQTEDIAKLADRFPALRPNLQAGIRSTMAIPLISKDQVIGALHFRSFKSNAYTEMDFRIAERVSDQIAGAVANAQLFTERKRVELALRESEERYRELFDEAPVGYVELDAEGRITRVNHTELEILGYTAEEMTGQFLWKFNVEEEKSRQSIMAKIAGTVPPGKAFERIYRKRDGTTIPVLLENKLLKDEEGRIIGMRSTIQDITERKRAEERLAASGERYRTLFEGAAEGILVTDIEGQQFKYAAWWTFTQRRRSTTWRPTSRPRHAAR